MKPADRSHSILDIIGKTPLVELSHLPSKPEVRIFAKLEGQNPTGSVKDRVALALVESAESSGLLKPGDTIVEASTGNTAIALAMVAKQKGYKVHVVIPHGVAPSISDILDLLKVDVTWCEPQAGMKSAIDIAQDMGAERGMFNLGQFENPTNTQTHYMTTGREIAQQLPNVDAFIAGIGTGGTLMGVARRLREKNPNVQIIGVEPRLGDRLQGLRSLDDAYVSPLLDLGMLNSRFLVGSSAALATAQQIFHSEGISAGVSSGATLNIALRVAQKMKRGKIVVMFSDGGWKYLPARPWAVGKEQELALDETHWW